MPACIQSALSLAIVALLHVQVNSGPIHSFRPKDIFPDLKAWYQPGPAAHLTSALAEIAEILINGTTYLGPDPTGAYLIREEVKSITITALNKLNALLDDAGHMDGEGVYTFKEQDDKDSNSPIMCAVAGLLQDIATVEASSEPIHSFRPKQIFQHLINWYMPGPAGKLSAALMEIVDLLINGTQYLGLTPTGPLLVREEMLRPIMEAHEKLAYVERMLTSVREIAFVLVTPEVSFHVTATVIIALDKLGAVLEVAGHLDEQGVFTFAKQDDKESEASFGALAGRVRTIASSLLDIVVGNPKHITEDFA